MIFGMKAPESSLPMRLAWWAGVGSLVSVSTFLILLLPIPRLSVAGHGARVFLWENLLRIIASLVPLCCGLIMMWRAERRLRRGIKNDSWTDEELEPLRRLMAHPAVIIGSFIPPIFWLGYVISSDRFRGAALVCIFIIPVQLVWRLKTTVMPQGAEGGVMFQDGGDFKRIQSKHWGESR